MAFCKWNYVSHTNGIAMTRHSFYLCMYWCIGSNLLRLVNNITTLVNILIIQQFIVYCFFHTQKVNILKEASLNSPWMVHWSNLISERFRLVRDDESLKTAQWNQNWSTFSQISGLLWHFSIFSDWKKWFRNWNHWKFES